MDDAGLDMYSSRHRGVRVPWAAIIEVGIGTAGKSGERYVLTLRLANGISLTLPAPVGRARDVAFFDAQAHEIIDAYERSGAGSRVAASDEPKDAISLEYRVEEAGRIEKYHRPPLLFELRRPVSILLLTLFFGGLLAFAASVRGYTQDLPGVDAYRAASWCSAPGGTAPAYCIVADGQVDQPLTRQDSDAYRLSVGLSAESVAGSPAPAKSVTFDTDEPALDELQIGDPIEYIVSDGGQVASVISEGVTYQSTSSPQARYMSGWAAMFGSVEFALLSASLLGLRLAGRRLRLPWMALPLAFLLAFITDISILSTISRPPTSAPALLWLTALPVACIVGLGTGAWYWKFRRRARRPVSRRSRALP